MERKIVIGRDLLENAGVLTSRKIKLCKICLVSDETVCRLFGEIVKSSLLGAGYEVCVFTFPPGERSKNMNTLTSLLEFMAEELMTRSDGIAALGGGVTGDIAGFAASCYLRGLPYIQIPTTLLAAVDASVGGKTGVNLEGGKNLAGTFWKPSLVLCDCRVFDTLQRESLLDGVAEIVKYGVVADRGLFESVASSDITTLLENDFISQIIQKCVIIKQDIIKGDLRDKGKRQLLNFGHTIGHAIEKLSNYDVSHGHAVASGMYHISQLSYLAGLSPVDCSVELGRVLKKYGFSISCDYSSDAVIDAALADKKRTGDFITLVIPREIGDCRLVKVDMHKFREIVRKGF